VVVNQVAKVTTSQETSDVRRKRRLWRVIWIALGALGLYIGVNWWLFGWQPDAHMGYPRFLPKSKIRPFD
jgi:hypothetical protein